MPYCGYSRPCHICRPICCRPIRPICCNPHHRFPCCCHGGHGFHGFSTGVLLGILLRCF